MNGEGVDYLRFGQCCELSTAGRRGSLSAFRTHVPSHASEGAVESNRRERMLALQRTPLGELTNFNTRCHEPTGLIERFVQTLDAFIEIASRRRFDCQPQLGLPVLLAKRCARLQVFIEVPDLAYLYI